MERSRLEYMAIREDDGRVGTVQLAELYPVPANQEDTEMKDKAVMAKKFEFAQANVGSQLVYLEKRLKNEYDRKKNIR